MSLAASLLAGAAATAAAAPTASTGTSNALATSATTPTGFAPAARKLSPRPRTLAAPASLMAGETTAIDVTARKKSKCWLVLKQGGRTTKSKKKKLTTPKSKILQFPWTQSAGQPVGSLRAKVKCTRKGRKSATPWRTITVFGDGQPGTSRPRVHKPVRLSISTKNPAGRGGAAGSPRFGTVQVPGSRWLGGRGVNVVSNGGSTYDCPGGSCQYHKYGIKWQCVELVNRFLMSKGWSGRIWGNAKNIYANAPSSRFDKHRAGDGYTPRPGDVMVWGGARWGHVAVVDYVRAGYVHFVEQNSSPTGRNSRRLLAGGRPDRYGSMSFTGYLHAKANVPPVVKKPTPAPKPKPAPKPAPTPKPTPKPVAPPTATITVNTCNTYGNCDYWNPIWVHSNPGVSSRIADANRGQRFTARCWARGRTLTDGSNQTAEDDARQFTSALWFGVDHSGRRGYVPAAWTTKSESHLGLPAC